jgi:hypothetical protein
MIVVWVNVMSHSGSSTRTSRCTKRGGGVRTSKVSGGNRLNQSRSCKGIENYEEGFLIVEEMGDLSGEHITGRVNATSSSGSSPRPYLEVLAQAKEMFPRGRASSNW